MHIQDENRFNNKYTEIVFFNYCITWRVFYKKQKMLTLREHLSSPPVIWLCPCCSFFYLFVLSYYVLLRSEFRVVMYVTISTYNRCSVRLYLRLLLGELLSYLRYLCLFAHCCVQHILRCVFVLSVFVLCTLCCQCLGIVFLRLVYPMLPVSRDCLFTSCVPYVARVSGMSFYVLCTLCCPFLGNVHFWLPLRYSLTFYLNHMFTPNLASIVISLLVLVLITK